MLRGTGTEQEDKMNGSVAEFRVDLLVSGQMSGSPALRNSQNKSGTGTKSMRARVLGSLDSEPSEYCKQRDSHRTRQATWVCFLWHHQYSETHKPK